MREVWAVEDGRRAAVGLKFYQRAMEGDDDPQSAIEALDNVLGITSRDEQEELDQLCAAREVKLELEAERGAQRKQDPGPATH